jgi:hypothetical protein
MSPIPDPKVNVHLFLSRSLNRTLGFGPCPWFPVLDPQHWLKWNHRKLCQTFLNFLKFVQIYNLNLATLQCCGAGAPWSRIILMEPEHEPHKDDAAPQHCPKYLNITKTETYHIQWSFCYLTPQFTVLVRLDNIFCTRLW